MPIAYVQPVIDENMRCLCCKPYYNHPRGCPNYNKRRICPPQAPLLPEYFDMTKPILAAWIVFNLAAHRDRMKEKHPSWSKRQLDCCLYWQGGVKKRLKRKVEYNLNRAPLFESENLVATYVPEAMGVNVTETMKNVGVILEWPPENIVIKVAFVGVIETRILAAKANK